MDPINTSKLPSVRTFARDLEKRRAAGAVLTEVTKSKPAPVTEPTPEKPEDRKYQAPTWTGNKQKPKPETPVIAAEKDTLKPISAPKPKAPTESNIVVKVDNEDAATATIIRDTKKNRFRLVPAVFSSIGDWFKDQKRKRALKKIPKYTVPDATRRKGVIQKATSHTGKVASFDYSTIQERIKQRQERVAPKKPGFTWTPNTEPSQPLLEAPDKPMATTVAKPVVVPIITNIKIVPRKSVTTTKPSLPPVPPKAPTKLTDEIQLPLPSHLQSTALATAVEPAPVITTPEVLPQPIVTEVPQIITPTSEPAPEELIVDTTETQDTATQPDQPQKITSLRDWLFVINTNTIAVILAGLVCATVIFGIAVFFLFAGDDADLEVSILAPSYPSLIDAPLQPLSVPTPLSKPVLIETIQKNNEANSLDVLQAILISDSSEQDLISSQSIIDTLDLSLDSAFTQAISHIYFGSVNKSEPFILLKVTDANTALGSLLIWEDSIYTDTLPVLKRTADMDSGTLTTAVFSDSILNRDDVRILKTLAGTELLVYGIVDRNTIIITTSSSAFSALQAIKK